MQLKGALNTNLFNEHPPLPVKLTFFSFPRNIFHMNIYRTLNRFFNPFKIVDYISQRSTDIYNLFRIIKSL